MGILGYIIVGLLAGAIAKAIMPGKQGGGILMTMVLGIIGALVGGLLTNLIMNGTLSFAINSGFWVSLLISVVGALIVLFIYTRVAGRGRSAA
ncbi:GlsB/YeaQ/YmgE family stress response membrane protein [Naumannella sp. ID2617S]|uniref:GlsB/YeaQ/YmgE family stress response membrane protein n=1 Tax=Enemella dayhoffiae TaxID=2016507 RepID=A0A255H8Q7_9ACTN|nr:GlsB/YeaQ/YmgE family stress response membrane protein [Enemella dayhoffiae]NNG18209.1 GlsB/YeaQ/YmgE family stress response membrane protein [Naumannella sp. ID2617S]OYO23981.1 GlsB/YeaQ/YmgE family stress response membrane protein [Enemella dayhoffiae]